MISVNGHTLIVTDNVFYTWRELRDRSAKRRISVDSICINQSDRSGKDSQAQQMCNIYGNVRSVIVWLGKAPVDFGCALNSIRHIAYSESTSNDNAIDTQSEAWLKPFIEIITRGWRAAYLDCPGGHTEP